MHLKAECRQWDLMLYNYHVPQHGSRQSFPSVGTSPSQMYSGLGRQPKLKSTLHFNNVSIKQSVSMGGGDNSTQAIQVPTNEQGNKEIVKPNASKVDQVAPIGEEVIPVAVIEEEVTPLPSIKEGVTSVEEETSVAFIEEAKKLVLLIKEVKNPVAFMEEAKNLVAFIEETKNSAAVIDGEATLVAVIEEKATPITVTEEKIEHVEPIENMYPMKRQQNKNKESLFNLFRKKR